MATSEPVLEVDRSESFTNGLLHNLWDMKTHGELTDLTIITASVPIPCHSNVMAAASEHVRDLLKGPMKGNTNEQIKLNFDEVYVQKVVDYCYTGKISIELSAVKSYLCIAEYLHLTQLKGQVDEFVCEHVSPKTCIGWYWMAKEFSLGALEKKSREIVAAKFKEMTGYTFHHLPAEELKDYIKFGEDADVVLEACASWMKFNIMERSEDFLDLLNHIQLDQCSPQCVERVLQTWKPIWPNFTEVQQALRPLVSAVPSAPAKPRELTILLLGGYTQTNVLNTKWWKLDMAAGTCTLYTTTGHTAVSYNPGYCTIPEKLFVIGGSKTLRDGTLQRSRDCHALSVQDSHCEAWPDMKVPTAGTIAIYLNDHIYTFGGDTTDKAVYRLNVKTKLLTRCIDIPVRNCYPIIAAITDKVYMIFNTTMYNAKFQTSSRVAMYCFDTSTLTWTSLTPLPVSIQDTSGSRAVSVGEDIYLVGGYEKLCARYSPQHDAWTILETPVAQHAGFSAVHMDGEIVLCGGFDSKSKVHYTIEVYNIAQNSWKVHSVRMPVLLQFHHCAVYDEEARKLLL